MAILSYYLIRNTGSSYRVVK